MTSLTSPTLRPSHAIVTSLLLGLGACPAQPSGDSGDEANEGDSDGEDCPVGALGCECLVEQCLGELVCTDGICTGCTPGSLGCSCVDGLCLGDNECVADLCLPPDADTSSSDDADTSSSNDADTSSSDDDTTTGDGDGDTNTCDSPDGALGCVFQAVKLPISDYQVAVDLPMELLIGNPGPDDTEVIVERRVDGVWTNVAGPILVPAVDTHSFYFHDSSDIVPVGHHEGFAYRVTSTEPVAVHQYNSNAPYWHGATNLLPTLVWDYEYEVTSIGTSNSYIVIVAENDDTTVQIDTPALIQAGPEVPATARPFQVLMQAGETIGIFSTGQTLTGTKVSTDPNHPIGVFVGERLTARYEEQLLGKSFADDVHVGIYTPEKFTGPICCNYTDPLQPTYYVYSLTAGTALLVDATPNTTGLPPVPTVLAQGQLYSFSPNANAIPELGDVLIQTTNPVHVLSRPPEKRGLAQMIPASRMASRYALPVPDGAGGQIFVVVAYPDGASFTIDGAVPDTLYDAYELAPGWFALRVQLTAGMHVLEASEPVAVVYGSGSGASEGFAFSAGLQP